MAGTNTTQQASLPATAPAVILVRPQLGENIGMCARAMLNCGVTELRLVAPRDGWPNPDATAAASGAVTLLDHAKVYATTAEAVEDLHYVVATTARGRDLEKPVMNSDKAAALLREKGAGCGILFGPERTGLENDDIALADAILNIPLNPGFSSLNLAQAVLLVCHAWLSADNPFVPEAAENMPAPKKEIETLMTMLEDQLAEGGFFRSPDQRPTLMRNIRNYFFRSAPSEQEVRTLHGIFACLYGKKKRGQ